MLHRLAGRKVGANQGYSITRQSSPLKSTATNYFNIEGYPEEKRGVAGEGCELEVLAEFPLITQFFVNSDCPKRKESPPLGSTTNQGASAMGRSFQQQSLRRKLIYFGLIAGLFTVSYAVRHADFTLARARFSGIAAQAGRSTCANRTRARQT